MKTAACGKFIVCGEHAVMYGSPSLAYPLKSAQIQIDFNRSPAKENSLEVFWNDRIISIDQKFLIEKCLNELGFRSHESQRIKLNVKSSFASGSGLGSSAALCVALAKSTSTNHNEILNRAIAGEKAFHGNPSGVDPTAVMSSGPIVFSTFGANFEYSSIDIPSLGFWVLRSSGESHSTEKVLIALNQLNSRLRKSLIETLTNCSQRFIGLINFFNNNSSLHEAISILDEITMAHRKMNLIIPSMEEAMTSLQQEGAKGVKLTGAGCGGYVLGFFEGTSLPISYKPRSNDFVVTLSGDDVTSEILHS